MRETRRKVGFKLIRVVTRLYALEISSIGINAKNSVFASGKNKFNIDCNSWFSGHNLQYLTIQTFFYCSVKENCSRATASFLTRLSERKWTFQSHYCLKYMSNDNMPEFTEKNSFVFEVNCVTTFWQQILFISNWCMNLNETNDANLSKFYHFHHNGAFNATELISVLALTPDIFMFKTNNAISLLSPYYTDVIFSCLIELRTQNIVFFY